MARRGREPVGVITDPQPKENLLAYGKPLKMRATVKKTKGKKPMDNAVGLTAAKSAKKEDDDDGETTES